MFELITPLSYWVLVVLWSVILGLYLVKLRHLEKAGGAIAVLLTILALDAFRTLFESLYFGLYFNSFFGFLPKHIYDMLARPELMVIPKVINIIAGVVVLILLIRRWIPREIRTTEAWISELTASEERMELALHGADLGTWDWNLQTGELIFNERWAEMLGYAVEEIEPHVRGWERLAHPEDRLNSERILVEHLKGKTDSYETEQRLRHKSGAWVWVLDRGRVIKRTADGKPLRACGTYLDITKRKQAEEALRKSEHLLLESQRVAQIGSYVLDISSGTCKVSLTLNHIFGVGEDYEHSLAGWLDLVHPEDREWLSDYLFHDVIGERSHFDKEYRIVRQNDGAERWMHGLGKLEFDAQSQPQRMLGTVQDITKRKRAEEGQRKTLILLKAVHEANPDLQFVLDFDGTITHYHSNDTMDLYVPSEEFLGKRMQDVLPEEISEKFEHAILDARTKESLVTIEYALPMPKGKRFYEGRVMSLSDRRLVVMIRDITERKQTEEALRKLVEVTSFQIGSALFDSITMALSEILGAACISIGEVQETLKQPLRTISVTIEGRRVDNFEYDLSGTPCENVVGKSIRSYASGVAELFPEDALLKEMKVESYIGVPLFDSQGGTLGNLAALFREPIDDVEFKQSVLQLFSLRIESEMERTRFDKALTESENRLSAITNQSCDGITVADTDGNYIFVNAAFCEMIGYSEEELLQMTVFDVKAKSQDPSSFARSKTSEVGLPIQVLLERKDGTEFTSEVIGQMITIDGETCVLGTVRDITDRKRAEEQVVASLKEKEVLLREIHHRVKNNMQVIVSLLRMHARRSRSERMRSIFHDCQDRVNAMALIHETLYQSEDLARINFGTYLTKLCRNLSRAHGVSGKGIAVMVRQCEVSLGMDQGVAVGMVICELVSNSFKYAFPEGEMGVVAVSLSNSDAEIELIVRDDGVGLPQEIDIFNSPSLGLELVVAAVTGELRGHIDVEREEGTRFVIRFRAGCASST